MGCFDIFIFAFYIYFLSHSLCETPQYRLKHCLKEPLKPKTTNQQIYQEDKRYQTATFRKVNTVESHWLERLWDHENMFEAEVVRANEC